MKKINRINKYYLISYIYNQAISDAKIKKNHENQIILYIDLPFIKKIPQYTLLEFVASILDEADKLHIAHRQLKILNSRISYAYDYFNDKSYTNVGLYFVFKYFNNRLWVACDLDTDEDINNVMKYKFWAETQGQKDVFDNIIFYKHISFDNFYHYETNIFNATF